MGGLIGTANEDKNGLLSTLFYRRLNQIWLSWGTPGGQPTNWRKIAKYTRGTYVPIQIEMYHGFYSGTKTKYSLSITFQEISNVQVTGSAGSNLGYTIDSSNETLTLYAKCSAGNNMSAIIVGGNIIDTAQSNTTTEPEGIVYIP